MKSYEENKGFDFYKNNIATTSLQEDASKILKETLGLEVSSSAWEQEKVGGSKNLLLDIPELNFKLVYNPRFGGARTIGYYTGSRFDGTERYNSIKNLSDLGRAINYFRKK